MLPPMPAVLTPDDLYNLLCRDYEVEEIVKYDSKKDAMLGICWEEEMFPEDFRGYVFISDNIVGFY